MSKAFTPGAAEAWRRAVPSDAWWALTVPAAIAACLLAVGSTDQTPLVVGGVAAAAIFLVTWPALGTAVALALAVGMPFVAAEGRVRVAVAGFAAIAAVLLAVRARGQFRQLRIVEDAVHTQRVPHGPRVLGPWLWARGLAAGGAGVAFVAAGLLLTVATRTVDAGPRAADWSALLWPPLLATALVLLRFASAPYLRPNRWAGIRVEAQVWPTGAVLLRADGDRTAFARYVASLPAVLADGTPESTAPPPPPTAPYSPPAAWQTARRVPDPPRAAVKPVAPPPEDGGRTWVAGDLVGDVRDGGWVAIVVDGAVLAPIAPLQARGGSDVLDRLAQAGAPRGFQRFKASVGLFLGSIALLAGGLVGAANEWPVATGQATPGRITITDRSCSADGDTCTSFGRFVSDDGTRLVERVRFDRDEAIGTTHPAALTDDDTAQSAGSLDFAFFGGLAATGALLGLLWLWRVIGRRLRPAPRR